MGNLFTTLLNASNALGVYSQALQVVQNNVANASTPGYARQTATFEALPFDLSVGIPGGVAAGPVESSRNAYAEQQVRNAQSDLGFYQQQTTDLNPLSSLFDVTGKSGIGPAINGLFNSFSQLSVSPNDATARQVVLNNANTLAQAIRQTASGLGQAQVRNETTSAVDEINRLAATVAQLNGENPVNPDGTTDAGIDAQLNSTLEQLSQYTNFTALRQPNGAVTLYIGGQTPLVTGTEAQPIQADLSSGKAAILDSSGNDISSQITKGQLAGALDVANSKLPGYVSSLNTLAQGLADQVNTALNNGVDQNGAAPTQDLFTYDPVVGAASTFAVNSALSPDQIAAALPGAPGGNGNALSLAALGNATTLNGMTFAQFYGNVGSAVGSDLSLAQNGQDAQTQIVTQAQALRSQASGVSLDQEAASLIQFQNAYQAAAKMVTVLNDITGSVLAMIQP